MKKILNLIIVLLLLILPFGMLVNVKAEGVQIVTTTGNLVNNDVTIVIRNIAPNDNFQAYKIVDIFYDEDTNAMTYGFTTNFQNFITNSQDANINTLTIDKYMKLSDDSRTITINGIDQPNVKEILMKYYTYIESNNISGISLVKNNNVINQSLKAGVYLVLPNGIGSYSNSTYGGISMFYNTYKMVLVNAVFTVDNNEWQLENQTITLKYNNGGIEVGAFTTNTATLKTGIDQSGYASIIPYFNSPTSFRINKDYSVAYYADGSSKFDISKANDSIKNNAVIANRIKFVDIIFPEGIDYDINKIYTAGDYTFDNLTVPNTIHGITIDNGDIYLEEDINKEYPIQQIVASNKKLSFSGNYRLWSNYFDVRLNNNYVVGGAGNPIKFVMYELNDLYTTLTETITDADIENAFVYAGTANDTTKYQQIRKVLNRVEISIPVYVYGVEITNYEQDTTMNLTGAEFGIFEYDTTNSTCTNTQIGSNFTINGNNYKANFTGIDGTNKYCVKQVKTPTGYKLNTTPVVFGPSTDNSTIDQNGNYAITIYNTRMSALPFTGGLGTIIYTCIGLIIMIVTATFIVLNKRKA